MLTKICENKSGVIFQSDTIPSSLFNFYILRRRTFKDGTAQWNLCCELSENPDKFMIIKIIRGTKEEATKQLEKLLHP